MSRKRDGGGQYQASALARHWVFCVRAERGSAAAPAATVPYFNRSHLVSPLDRGCPREVSILSCGSCEPATCVACAPMPQQFTGNASPAIRGTHLNRHGAKPRRLLHQRVGASFLHACCASMPAIEFLGRSLLAVQFMAEWQPDGLCSL